ncbi:MAG: hypothetical protein Q7R47_03320 [Candidatus Diapherotrites archaeon]|nr:hypothetical protein [Candidatus Diapherotrites archaeon]
MAKLRVLVFGNPLVEQDSIALAILPQLRERFPDIDFVEFDAAEDLEKEGRELVILDAVAGIKKVTLISDLDSLQLVQTKRMSLHDFDLGQSLGLMKAAGMLDSVRIIGVPMRYPTKKAFLEVVAMLSGIH